ncbi:BZ3500_MvSof-1268-A1-R1_Chr4-2g07082 [Microbotryum saponariae]|uniref:BZ3500_MvSof-1268-A1-R1_Chr4-2g07082 protein n=1 Tax=Microbotryum saponariae TaxID=289078 RepID=A0A2X0LEA1_9BASI|nr:BZ3500_MvSof-1268-A1-R1_Chr4-2g07082 [Microbotryum saponariae]SDA06747.1 BZ3501_MvSof-1269-A2-R1_Chr4-2g06793 [Microbotryum saponariae]
MANARIRHRQDSFRRRTPPGHRWGRDTAGPPLKLDSNDLWPFAIKRISTLPSYEDRSSMMRIHPVFHLSLPCLVSRTSSASPPQCSALAPARRPVVRILRRVGRRHGGATKVGVKGTRLLITKDLILHELLRIPKTITTLSNIGNSGLLEGLISPGREISASGSQSKGRLDHRAPSSWRS